MAELPLPRIGIDLEGSDAEAKYLLLHFLPLLRTYDQQAHFVFIGHDDALSPLIPPQHSFLKSQSIIHAEDSLLQLTKKHNSSIHTGIQALKKQQIDALISLGSTAALVTIAKQELGMIPPLTRPALIAHIPFPEHPFTLLDAGAHLSPSPEHLLHTALLGVCYLQALGVSHPIVKLLNIGQEPSKGTQAMKQAYQLLTSYPFFAGNIEPQELFINPANIILTDGWTGNILLKTLEGMAPLLTQEKKPLSLQGSALLGGIQGIIIKCHGSGNPDALPHAIEKALSLHHQKFIQKLTLPKE